MVAVRAGVVEIRRNCYVVSKEPPVTRAVVIHGHLLATEVTTEYGGYHLWRAGKRMDVGKSKPKKITITVDSGILSSRQPAAALSGVS